MAPPSRGAKTRPTVCLLGRPVEKLAFTHAVFKHAKGATPPGSHSAVNRSLLARVSTTVGEAPLVGTSRTYTRISQETPGGWDVAFQSGAVQDNACSCH